MYMFLQYILYCTTSIYVVLRTCEVRTNTLVKKMFFCCSVYLVAPGGKMDLLMRRREELYKNPCPALDFYLQAFVSL